MVLSPQALLRRSVETSQLQAPPCRPDLGPLGHLWAAEPVGCNSISLSLSHSLSLSCSLETGHSARFRAALGAPGLSAHTASPGGPGWDGRGSQPPPWQWRRCVHVPRDIGVRGGIEHSRARLGRQGCKRQGQGEVAGWDGHWKMGMAGQTCPGHPAAGPDGAGVYSNATLSCLSLSRPAWPGLLEVWSSPRHGGKAPRVQEHVLPSRGLGARAAGRGSSADHGSGTDLSPLHTLAGVEGSRRSAVKMREALGALPGPSGFWRSPAPLSPPGPCPGWGMARRQRGAGGVGGGTGRR